MILAWVNGIYEGVASFLVGMRTTARFFAENVRGNGGAMAVTRQYPQEPAVTVGTRVRGHLVNDAPRCIVCHACDKACPVDCFVMDMERTGENKPRASRFDIDLSKCIYCGLCVRACPTGSLSMTTGFEIDPRHKGSRYLFRRSADQLDRRLEEPDVVRLARLANQPREQLAAEDRAWLDSVIDPQGPHLIGMYGMGYYTPEQKAAADAEREKKKAEAAAKAAALKKAKEDEAKKKAAAAIAPGGQGSGAGGQGTTASEAPRAMDLKPQASSLKPEPPTGGSP